MPQTIAERIKTLQSEAKAEARIAVNQFANQLLQLSEDAEAIVSMGDAVPVGIRQMASTIVTNAAAQSQSIRKLNQ